jgi:hypothetical protein
MILSIGFWIFSPKTDFLAWLFLSHLEISRPRVGKILDISPNH